MLAAVEAGALEPVARDAEVGDQAAVAAAAAADRAEAVAFRAGGCGAGELALGPLVELGELVGSGNAGVGLAPPRAEDELFLVLAGRLWMELRDRTLVLGPGELVVVPRGVEHRPCADEEVELLLFEPAGTLNTGDAVDERTVLEPERI